MSEVIDKPIEVATEILDRAEINGGTVLVQYGKTEAVLATLRTKYEGVLFDLTTTARAGRLELVTLRTSLEKKRKEFKAPALEFGAIAERLGFALSADFLRLLGFDPAAKVGAHGVYHEASFPLICAALVAHIEAVQAKQAA